MASNADFTYPYCTEYLITKEMRHLIAVLPTVTEDEYNTIIGDRADIHI